MSRSPGDMKGSTGGSGGRSIEGEKQSTGGFGGRPEDVKESIGGSRERSEITERY